VEDRNALLVHMVTIMRIIGPNMHTAQVSQIGKTLRMLRILRTLRVLRFLRVGGAFKGLMELVLNERSLILAKIFRMICFITIMNHYFACGWYLVSHQLDGGHPKLQGWVRRLGFLDFYALVTDAIHSSIHGGVPRHHG